MGIETSSPHQAAGATLPIQSIRHCVLYDPATGEIHHHHQVLTVVGGREPSQQQMEHDALHSANRRHPGRTLAVLHVSHDSVERGRRYRVDTEKQSLVPLD